MVADFNHPPFFEHDDLKCITDRREPVRDDDRGPIAHEHLQCAANGLLVDSVKV